MLQFANETCHSLFPVQPGTHDRSQQRCQPFTAQQVLRKVLEASGLEGTQAAVSQEESGSQNVTANAVGNALRTRAQVVCRRDGPYVFERAEAGSDVLVQLRHKPAARLIEDDVLDTQRGCHSRRDRNFSLLIRGVVAHRQTELRLDPAPVHLKQDVPGIAPAAQWYDDGSIVRQPATHGLAEDFGEYVERFDPADRSR
jgi:hypothetical protein